jgi:hypothetical protein
MGVQQTFGGMARVIFPIRFGFLYDRSAGLPFLVSAGLVLFTVYLGIGMDAYVRKDPTAAAA